MKINCFAGLLALSTLGLAAISPAAHAQTNGSFEEPALQYGGFTSNVIPGWNSTATAPFSFGVFYPGAANSGSYIYTQPIPDGNQVAYINDAVVYQDLVNTVTANTKYDLSFYVGSRKDNHGSGTAFLETTSGNILGSQTLSPADGTFGNGLVEYVAGNADPYLGQTLRIVLTKAGGDQANFDAVKLTQSVSGTSTVPEGSSILLLFGGMAPFGLGLLSRRHNRKS